MKDKLNTSIPYLVIKVEVEKFIVQNRIDIERVGIIPDEVEILGEMTVTSTGEKLYFFINFFYFTNKKETPSGFLAILSPKPKL